MPNCIVCDSSSLTATSGMVAPFLAKRIWGKKPFSATLLQCKDCGFQFFNPRLSADEEHRLYANYRGDQYQSERHATEPWYTRNLNAGLSAPETMARRREAVAQVLTSNLPPGSVSTVLDFGGARGELVDSLLPNTRCFVYDISEVPPLPGITFVPLGKRDERFDLILCSNVFEHVASPRDLLQEIVSFCSPGTMVFIEVPDESPRSATNKLKRVVQAGILTVTRPGTALEVLKLHPTLIMHEHLNFYSPSSLSRLMTTVPGMKVLSQGAYSLPGGRLLWVLAQFGERPPQEVQ